MDKSEEKQVLHDDKIFNPKTKRWVKKTGQIEKKLLAPAAKSDEKPAISVKFTKTQWQHACPQTSDKTQICSTLQSISAAPITVKYPTSDYSDSDDDRRYSDSDDENSYSYQAWQLSEEINKHNKKRCYEDLTEWEKERFDRAWDNYTR